MNNIKLIKIELLKAHEKTDKTNLQRVKRKIERADCFTCPIIVDQKNLVILDGHHRTQVLKKLGFKKIPAYLVNYGSTKIKVISRRKNIDVSKKIIIQNALANRLFPYKTSKHFIPNCPKNLKINLAKLL